MASPMNTDNKLEALSQKIACRLRQSGLHTDKQLADELETALTPTADDSELVEAIASLEKVLKWHCGDDCHEDERGHDKLCGQPEWNTIKKSLLPRRQDDALEKADKAISAIAVMSNPDWDMARVDTAKTLDKIHTKTSELIGDVMKRDAIRTLAEGEQSQ